MLFRSSAGDILFYLAFMTYASKLENYSLALSLIAISESVPKLFTIFGGYFADKTQRKFRNIFMTALARCILYGLVGFLFISRIDQWNLVIIRTARRGRPADDSSTPTTSASAAAARSMSLPS